MEQNEIRIKCPFGFANQLRLSLAANMTVQKGYADRAVQEWVINNHNMVDYEKFFEKLPHLEFGEVDQTAERRTRALSFSVFVRDVVRDEGLSYESAFREAFSCLRMKKEWENELDGRFRDMGVKACIGVHLRTGCKTAMLRERPKRSEPIPHEKIIRMLKACEDPIYLATDNKETQDKFISIFGDRIKYFEKIHEGREEFEGEYEHGKVRRHVSDIHTVADLYALIRCGKLIGSNESSFSLMAKWARNNREDMRLDGWL